MKIKILLILLITSFLAFSQKGGEICKEDKEGNYFIFSIEKEEKLIAWFDTFLLQKIRKEQKKINGKWYYEIIQIKANTNEKLINFLREGKGVIYKYEACCEKETILFDPKFEIGKVWKSADGKTKMKLISYNAKLKTPLCEYHNLLEIEVTMKAGKFHDYYLKGQGFVGTTIVNKNEKLISFFAKRF